MEPQFPLFIQLDEPTVTMVETPERIGYHFEENDIVYENPRGWDCRGYPVRLLWDSKSGPKTLVVGNLAEPDTLKAAILRNADGAPQEELTSVPTQTDDPVVLYESIEHLRREVEARWSREHSILTKVRRIIDRLLRRV